MLSVAGRLMGERDVEAASQPLFEHRQAISEQRLERGPVRNGDREVDRRRAPAPPQAPPLRRGAPPARCAARHPGTCGRGSGPSERRRSGREVPTGRSRREDGSGRSRNGPEPDDSAGSRRPEPFEAPQTAATPRRMPARTGSGRPLAQRIAPRRAGGRPRRLAAEAGCRRRRWAGRARFVFGGGSRRSPSCRRASSRPMPCASS